MAKSDLLKEAIADAKAVKETALANAKIALEEAFAPRIQSMLSTKLAEDEMYEDKMDDMDMEAPEGALETEDPTEGKYMEGEMYEEEGLEDMMGAEEAPVDDVAVDAEMDMEAPVEGPSSVTIDGVEYAPVGGAEEEMAMDMEAPVDDMPADDDELELESIIRELEEDLNEGDEEAVADHNEEEQVLEGYDANAEMDKGEDIQEDFNIDEIIESILSEEDDIVDAEEDAVEEPVDDSVKEELEEAYNTIHSLRHTINEVNLLNAKLLYTNKLFRNFELNENQKMKVIENFDRAGTTREVKLVFSTLAESFNVPVKKRVMVKESFASKPVGTTAPSKETKQIINEGNELANRWKKLAGLLD